MFWKVESKDDVEGGQQERRKVVKNVMNRLQEREREEGKNPEEIEETWIEVKTRTRTQEPRQPERVRKNRPMVQIFVKMDGLKTSP